MSKATCSKCGYMVPLEGKKTWTIEEAIKYLLDKQSNHNCEKIIENRLSKLKDTMEWTT